MRSREAGLLVEKRECGIAGSHAGGVHVPVPLSRDDRKRIRICIYGRFVRRLFLASRRAEKDNCRNYEKMTFYDNGANRSVMMAVPDKNNEYTDDVTIISYFSV